MLEKLLVVLLFAQIGQKQEMLSPSELLHRSAMRGDTDAIEMLLKLGADVNSADQHGKTALHDAALGGSAKAIELLVERKADIDARDSKGLAPLDYALKLERADAARVL